MVLWLPLVYTKKTADWRAWWQPPAHLQQQVVFRRQVPQPSHLALGGGFSPIHMMEFLGQSEAKGSALHKCKRLFNVREIQKPGENFVITGKIIKSTSVKEAWNMRFDIDLVTRKVIKASCSCYVSSTGKCKHCGALYKYINSERPVGKTDQEQQWTTPYGW